MRKLTTLFILSLLPFLVQGQSISLDELIQIQKTPKNDLNYIASVIIPNKLKQIESLEETPEDLGRKVWRISDDTKVTLFYGKDVNNRVVFQSSSSWDYFEIQKKINEYGMAQLDYEQDDGIEITTFIGVNYVIIEYYYNQLYAKYFKPFNFEIYKKEDYFENKDLILASKRYQIGDNFLGGIVFSVSETGRHGYIMTPFDVASDAIYIDAILAAIRFQDNKNEFSKDANQYSFWNLGSAELMNLIYLNLGKPGIVNFENKFLWTSEKYGDYQTIINLRTGEKKLASSENYENRYSIIMVRKF